MAVTPATPTNTPLKKTTQKTQEAVPKTDRKRKTKTHHHHASRNIDGWFPRSRTMMMHGLALLSLHNSVVHSQANLNNIYFDHININTYDYLENKIT